MTMEPKITPGLAGVPETLLWTLYHRAAEARRPDAVLADPMAIRLVDSIDYPFGERFGTDVQARAQWQALRTRRFDDEVRRFLDRYPDGTVVALGEGLETQFWRVDNGRVRWLGVDLPEVTELRQRMLPAEPRARSIPCSVLDDRWLDEIDAGNVLITAQGLLMYLQPEEVHGLIGTWAGRLPGATLVFDAVLRWFSARTMRGGMPVRRGGYATPQMPWGIDDSEIARLRTVPGVAEMRRLRLPRGRGLLFGYVMPLASRAPVLRNITPIWILRARFAG